jgi:hypothetical protein
MLQQFFKVASGFCCKSIYITFIFCNITIEKYCNNFVVTIYILLYEARTLVAIIFALGGKSRSHMCCKYLEGWGQRYIPFLSNGSALDDGFIFGELRWKFKTMFLS